MRPQYSQHHFNPGRARQPHFNPGRARQPHFNHGYPRQSHPSRQTLTKCHLCHKFVADLKSHKKHVHQTKNWGFECPACLHFESSHDQGLMKRHLQTAAHQPPITLDQCAKFVARGYTLPARCRVAGCLHKSSSEFELGIHAARQHPQPQPLEMYHTMASAGVATHVMATAGVPTHAMATASTMTPLMAGMRVGAGEPESPYSTAPPTPSQPQPPAQMATQPLTPPGPNSPAGDTGDQ